MSVVSISELVQFSASGVGGGVFEHKSNIPILSSYKQYYLTSLWGHQYVPTRMHRCGDMDIFTLVSNSVPRWQSPLG